MQADKQEREVLGKALDEWKDAGLLTPEHAAQLRGTIKAKESGTEQLAHYFFIIAVCCALLAFGALFIDEKLLQRLQQTFLLHNITIAVAAMILSAICFRFARRQRPVVSVAAYELYLVPGTLTALISLVYICKETGNGDGYTFFLGLASIMLGALCIVFRSRMLWCGFLLAGMGWFGAFSTVHSHDNLFLGMNYPVRFTLFGLLVLVLSWGQRKIPRLDGYYRISYHAGLLIFFTALWGLSVFGNYGYLDQWAAVRQTQVLGFSFLFGAATGIALYLGIRYDDPAVRDYSILFLLLNLYTRYFEYFWNSMNKGLFFLFLALSFWLLGRWLNKRKTREQIPGKP